MALYPEGDVLDAFQSRYILANLAARRAKQIRDGAPILIETSSSHPLTIALEEIADGAVKPILVDGEIQPVPAHSLESLDELAREVDDFESLAGFLSDQQAESTTGLAEKMTIEQGEDTPGEFEEFDETLRELFGDSAGPLDTETTDEILLSELGGPDVGEDGDLQE
jgi:DNA-directed RNA polymerase omega subunit